MDVSHTLYKNVTHGELHLCHFNARKCYAIE